MGRYNSSQHTKEENDNHSRQLDKETDAYWQSRGYDERPDDWEEFEDDE